MDKNLAETSDAIEAQNLLDSLVRRGALMMLMAALESEVREFLGQYRDYLDRDGHRLVVDAAIFQRGRF